MYSYQSMLQHGDTAFTEPMWVFTPKPELIYGASCIVLDPSHHFNKPEYYKVSTFCTCISNSSPLILNKIICGSVGMVVVLLMLEPMPLRVRSWLMAIHAYKLTPPLTWQVLYHLYQQ